MLWRAQQGLGGENMHVQGAWYGRLFYSVESNSQAPSMSPVVSHAPPVVTSHVPALL